MTTDTALEIAIRHAVVEDRERLLQAYVAWGYTGTITPRETILMAERGNELVGLVRLVPEEGTVVLRGMYVRPSDRRCGIGRKLLSAATLLLGTRECFCVPYEHLEGFYGRGGFQRCDVPTAPPFLQKRLEDYRGRGFNVLLLRRPETRTALRQF